MFLGRGRGGNVASIRGHFVTCGPRTGIIYFGQMQNLRIVANVGRGGVGNSFQIVLERKQKGNIDINNNITDDDDDDEADHYKDAKVLTNNSNKIYPIKSNRLLALGVFSTSVNKDDSVQITLASIPERLLLRIFTFVDETKMLTICEMVCRSWRYVINNNYWKPPFSNPVNVAKIPARKPTLFKTKVMSVKFEVSKTTKTISSSSSKDKDSNKAEFGQITFTMPIFLANRSNIVDMVGKAFAKLKVLSTVAFVDMEVTATMLNLLVQQQPWAHKLRFLRCLIDSDALATLKPVRGIRELALDHCYSAGDAISSKTMLPLIESNVIRHLEISGATILNQVDDRLMEALLTNWKYEKFDFLKLTNCPKISTQAIIKVIDHYVRTDNNRLVMFLRNTGFDVGSFLAEKKRFEKCQVPTTKRVLLKGNDVMIWVELA